jgi:hypothetical protein
MGVAFARIHDMVADVILDDLSHQTVHRATHRDDQMQHFAQPFSSSRARSSASICPRTRRTRFSSFVFRLTACAIVAENLLMGWWVSYMKNPG